MLLIFAAIWLGLGGKRMDGWLFTVLRDSKTQSNLQEAHPVSAVLFCLEYPYRVYCRIPRNTVTILMLSTYSLSWYMICEILSGTQK